MPGRSCSLVIMHTWTSKAPGVPLDFRLAPSSVSLESELVGLHSMRSSKVLGMRPRHSSWLRQLQGSCGQGRQFQARWLSRQSRWQTQMEKHAGWMARQTPRSMLRMVRLTRTFL